MSQNIIIYTLRNRSLKEIASRVADMTVGWCLRPLSLITRRSKRKWLIGNKTGWSDNSKYFMIFLNQDKTPRPRAIWISKSKKERDTVRSKGFEAYRKWSVKGVFHSLTAGAFFFSTDISDINYWTAGNTVKINMWHGVGIKKLGMKYSDLYNPKDLYSRIMTPYFYDRPTLFVGPSPMMARHFADCYLLDDNQILQTGYPRCDLLLSPTELVDKFVKRYESESTQRLYAELDRYDKVFVYMPTFRDDQSDFIVASGIDFNKLDELFMAKGYLLLLKLHPATRIDSSSVEKCSNIKTLDKHMDIYPILTKTHVLITDYSSIYYDYILMQDKEVLLFPFDYDSYIRNSRDLAFDYLTYTPGVKAWSFDELYQVIEHDTPLSFPQRQWVIDSFWGKNYQKSSSHIKKAAIKVLEDR